MKGSTLPSTPSEKPLKAFLELSYDELEEMNLQAAEKRDKLTVAEQEEEHRRYLEQEKRIKAVTLCFSDIEGRFHMLDYDKKFLLSSLDNLTFDGSSIRGFTQQKESDLRLQADWASMMWLPPDIFGPGKVIMFAKVLNREGGQYASDVRGLLQEYLQALKTQDGLTAFVSAEIEGFVVEGLHAEQHFEEQTGFNLIATGGYFHSLPLDPLRQFIDAAAEAQRAMGFRNEKDHPEVAPAQFEMNFSYTEALRACDLIQLYKLVCRQVAHKMGMTTTFLPKPVMGINGSGMHTNMSLAKNGKNLFYEGNGKENLSPFAWEYISRILEHAEELCLILNSSVNAYRRLDPHFEAPNQIKVSPMDRGSMIRIPVGNERSARIEVRSIAPDANPYLVVYSLLKTGLDNTIVVAGNEQGFLPASIYEAAKAFQQSDFIKKIIGRENAEKYLGYKLAAANRSPRDLGTIIKTSEILYHHEVTNQSLWNRF